MIPYRKNNLTHLKFGTYVLISASLFWLVMGSVFLYRASWGLSRATHYKSILTEHGVRFYSHSKQSKVLMFRIKDLPDSLGIYRRDSKKYIKFLNQMHVGDTLNLYVENWQHKSSQINTQILHLESNGKVLIHYKERRNRDLIVSIFLLLISSGLVIYAYRTEKKTEIELIQNLP